MRIRWCILAGLFLLAAAGAVAAQFGPPPFAPQPIYAPGTGPFVGQTAFHGDGRNLGWTWREYRSQKGTWYLHDAFGRRVGAFRETSFEYWPLDARTNRYGVACRPPVDLPKLNHLPVVPAKPTMNFGLDLSKIGQHGTRYFVGGRVVDRKTAFEAVEKGQLTDDSGKLRVTVFGSPARTKPVADAIRADSVGAKVHVQQYQPTDPMVKGLGFATPTDPTLYVQEPAGKVRHRSRTAPTPAEAVGAVRKANDGYRPAADPNLSAGGGLNLSGLAAFLGSIPGYAYALAGGLIVLILFPPNVKAVRP